MSRSTYPVAGLDDAEPDREGRPPDSRRVISNRWKLAVLVVAALAQLSLPLLGFYSTSADESARAIGANDATVVDLIRPDVWPPFYEVTVGLALDINDDLVVVPRIVTFIAGLICLWALMSMADRLFRDDRTTLIAGFVGALIPHRLVFSVAPMSEIFLFLFAILAANSLLAWIQTDEDRHGLAAAGWLLVATMVRYEAWVMAAVVAGYALWRYLRQRDAHLLGVAALCLGFPLIWLISNLTWPGDIRYLSLTSQQTSISLLPSRLQVTNTALYQFLKDLILIPGLLFGMTALAVNAKRSRPIRIWAALEFTPMILVSVAAFVSRSTPLASPWRLSGTWIIMVIPFFAYAVTWLWDSLTGRRALIAASVLLASGVFPMIGRTATKLSGSKLTTEELNIGRKVGNMLDGSSGQALIESSEGFEYLDMLVATGHLDRFILTRGEDPFVLAIFSGDIAAWENRDPDLIANHARVNYSFDQGVDPQVLACDGISLFLVQSDELESTAARTPGLSVAVVGAGWTLFRIEDECPGT